jgi:demethylmenaquinone methyltransferase/2-methoxy-6-polyprenyl-1,4-benzoquinol methylase
MHDDSSTRPSTREHVTLREAFSSADAKREYNLRIFTTIAPRYDLITRVLSYGQDQRWKRRLVALAGVQPGEAALDVACGTGDLAARVAADGARVVALDLTPAMLVLARRAHGATLRYVAGDIDRLPFATASFNVITAGYALRNVPDLDCALRELCRVLAPGGRLLALDFNRPAFAPASRAYLAYLAVVGSVLGWILHRDPDTYRYIAASLRRYPGAAAVAGRMRAAGFARAAWRPVLAGLLACHIAERGHGAVG